MRFPQLAIGQRFRHRGINYLKTGPLTARDEATGAERLMRKSIQVEPLAADPRPPNPAETADQAGCQAWLDDYRAGLRQAVTELADPAGRVSLEALLRLLNG